MKNNQIKIDCAKIPPIELKILCKTFVAAIEKFYDDPKNRERFEQWQKNRSEGVKAENE